MSRSLPASANPCVVSGDAGGGGNSGAGFLGIQWINGACWQDKLAEQERNAELKALLKCGAGKFRRSVAYMKPRKERQEYCVGYVKKIYVAEIAMEREAMQSARKHALELIAAELATQEPTEGK